jgi:protein-disulfide isomerase
MFAWKLPSGLLLLAVLAASAGGVRAQTAPAKPDASAQPCADALAAAQEAAIAKAQSRIAGEPGTQVLGNPDGDVTIVEFFDYQCPYCKADEPAIEALLKEDHGVKLILKEFPILGAPSLAASKAALASAQQGRYPAFHDALLAHKGHLDIEQIDGIAMESGVDLDRLHKDETAPEIADVIIGNLNLARSLKVTGTPGFIVGGKVLDSPRDAEDFTKAVAAARARKG